MYKINDNGYFVDDLSINQTIQKKNWICEIIMQVIGIPLRVSELQT